MEEKPLIDPVWVCDRDGDAYLYPVGVVRKGMRQAVGSVLVDLGHWFAWTEINEDGMTCGGRSGCEVDVKTAKAACEQALRDAGYRFADDPPRGSMTRGLPLADELDPAAYLPHAIAALHDVLKVGAERYPDEKWKSQNVAEHLRHAREHIRLHAIGDDSEPHLRHALTRLAFAVEIAEGGGG